LFKVSQTDIPGNNREKKKYDGKRRKTLRNTTES